MKYLTIKNYILYLFFVFTSQHIYAQQGPLWEWRSITWAPTDANGQAQAQDDSGEEWWYDHINFEDAQGNHAGYVTCGYAGWVNLSYFNPNDCFKQIVDFNSEWNCEELETEYYRRGVARATIAEFGLDGQMQWCKPYHYGWNQSIIRTSDGGYLTAGVTKSILPPPGSPVPLYYNPNRQTKYRFNEFTIENGCPGNRNHIIITKLDAAGNIQWSYLYGLPEYNVHDLGLTALAGSGEGQDAAEMPFGYRIVGTSSLGEIVRLPVVIDVDFNGYWLSSTIIGSGTQSGYAHDIARDGDRTVVSGYILGNDGLNVAFADMYDLSLVGNNSVWGGALQLPSNGQNQTSWDVCFSQDGHVLFPAIVNCDSGCQFGGSNVGEGRIYKLKRSNGNFLWKTPGYTSIGEVRAYDIKMGITPVSAEDFAIVTSKRFSGTTNPYGSWGDVPGSFDLTCTDTDVFEYWDTDAYVAKFDKKGHLIWETQFDSYSELPQPFPGDLKKQECLYKITESADGGLVISGNTGHNFDDNYLVKIYNDCQATIPNEDFNIVDVNDYDYEVGVNEIWNSSKKVKGIVRVKTGKKLTITGGGTLIEMASTNKVGVRTQFIVEQGGRMEVLAGAEITALTTCGDSKWNGIEVWGHADTPHPSFGAVYNGNYPSSANDHGVIVINNATLSHARTAITFSKDGPGAGHDLDYSGGFIWADHAQFINNVRSMEFIKFDASNNNSRIDCGIFKVNQDYRNGDVDPPTGHISNWDVHGVRIRGSAFSDETGSTYSFSNFSGINSIDGSFTLLDVSGNGNTFQDLHIGISALATSSLPKTYVINNSTFQGCNGGIYAKGLDNLSIVSNYFSFNNASNYGIYLEGSTSFYVSDNDIYNFSTPPAYQPQYGIVVRKSGSTANQLLRNSIRNLEYGITLYENNSGLELKCNENTNNYRDISIISSPTEVGQIRNPQGYAQPDSNSIDFATAPAGNRFSSSCVFSDSHFSMSSDVPVFTYYYHATPDHDPVCIRHNSIDKRNFGATYVPGVSCASGSGCKESDCHGIVRLEQAIAATESLLTQEEERNRSAGIDNAYMHRLQDKIKILEHKRDLFIKTIKQKNQIDAIAFFEQEYQKKVAAKNSMPSIIKTQRELINLYVEQKMWNKAQVILDQINQSHSEVDDFVILNQINKDLRQQKRSWFEMTDDEMNAIKEIASGANPTSMQAQNVLKMVKGQMFEVVLPTLNSAPSVKNNRRVSQKRKDNIELKVYPNPLVGKGRLKMELSQFVEEGQLDIVSMCGTVVYKSEITNRSSISISNMELPAGVYFVRISVKGKIYMDKIVIQ